MNVIDRFRKLFGFGNKDISPKKQLLPTVIQTRSGKTTANESKYFRSNDGNNRTSSKNSNQTPNSILSQNELENNDKNSDKSTAAKTQRSAHPGKKPNVNNGVKKELPPIIETQNEGSGEIDTTNGDLLGERHQLPNNDESMKKKALSIYFNLPKFNTPPPAACQILDKIDKYKDDINKKLPMLGCRAKVIKYNPYLLNFSDIQGITISETTPLEAGKLDFLTTDSEATIRKLLKNHTILIVQNSRKEIIGAIQRQKQGICWLKPKSPKISAYPSNYNTEHKLPKLFHNYTKVKKHELRRSDFLKQNVIFNSESKIIHYLNGDDSISQIDCSSLGENLRHVIKDDQDLIKFIYSNRQTEIFKPLVYAIVQNSKQSENPFTTQIKRDLDGISSQTKLMPQSPHQDYSQQVADELKQSYMQISEGKNVENNIFLRKLQHLILDLLPLYGEKHKDDFENVVDCLCCSLKSLKSSSKQIKGRGEKFYINLLRSIISDIDNKRLSSILSVNYIHLLIRDPLFEKEYPGLTESFKMEEIKGPLTIQEFINLMKAEDTKDTEFTRFTMLSAINALSELYLLTKSEPQPSKLDSLLGTIYRKLDQDSYTTFKNTCRSKKINMLKGLLATAHNFANVLKKAQEIEESKTVIEISKEKSTYSFVDPLNRKAAQQIRDALSNCYNAFIFNDGILAETNKTLDRLDSKCVSYVGKYLPKAWKVAKFYAFVKGTVNIMDDPLPKLPDFMPQFPWSKDNIPTIVLIPYSKEDCLLGKYSNLNPYEPNKRICDAYLDGKAQGKNDTEKEYIPLVKKLNETNEDLTNQVSNVTSQNIILQNNNTILAKNLTNTIEKVNNLTVINNALESNNTQLQIKNNYLQGNLSEAELQNIYLQGNNTQLQHNNTQLQTENNHLQGSLSEAEQRITYLQGNNTQLQNTNTQLQMENNDLKSNYTLLDTEFNEFKGNVSILVNNAWNEGYWNGSAYTAYAISNFTIFNITHALLTAAGTTYPYVNPNPTGNPYVDIGNLAVADVSYSQEQMRPPPYA